MSTDIIITPFISRTFRQALRFTSIGLGMYEEIFNPDDGEKEFSIIHPNIHISVLDKRDCVYVPDVACTGLVMINGDRTDQLLYAMVTNILDTTLFSSYRGGGNVWTRVPGSIGLDEILGYLKSPSLVFANYIGY